jgi:hypothetical protein
VIHRSRIADENSEDVSAHYEPVFLTVSTAYTPERQGNPGANRYVPL